MEVRTVVEAGDRLGEGPCWSAVEGRLYWFDIKGRRLH
jgi:sugar lactone lactonase YvrE